MVKKKMKKKAKVNLSGDVIESKILKRLPVKSLIQFTSVCKSWYFLLSDPYFINLYNQFQKNKISNLLLVDYDKGIVVKDSRSREQLSSFSDVCNFPYKSIEVVGCHNGIVCVSFYTAGTGLGNKTVEHGISLWNPALRINKKIVVSELNDSFWALPVGFGYHCQTNDYKVIRFYNNLMWLNQVEIYSLTSDSWRIIKLGANQLLEGHYVIEECGFYVSCYPGGAYCWLARKYEYGSYGFSTIISFHMEDESFKEMSLPCTSTGHGCKNTLFIYKDSLAVFHTRNSDASKDLSPQICYIWMMKEFDNPKSWTMLFKFDSPLPYVSFVGVVETDLIMLLCRDPLIKKEVNLVDIDKSQMKPMMSYTKDIGRARWVSSFTESLALSTTKSSFKE